MKLKPGGKLIFGAYTCHQTIYNGAGASPAFSYKYHGYFLLRLNGTYRWLDDGAEGKYSYNSKTGVITWLTGYMAAEKPRLSSYKITDPSFGQITVNFNDNYRWECGCKNK